jgi:hypothetical protein
MTTVMFVETLDGFQHFDATHPRNPRSCTSPDIIRQIKSRRMRWAGHVAGMGEERKSTRFWWESPKERDRSEDQGIDGRMGLELILVRLAWRVWTGFDWLRTGIGGGLL